MIINIVLIVLSVISTSFIFLFIIERKKNLAILANTIKLLIMQEQEQSINKTEKEKSNEDFLKFVSDSRDLAYTYIEEVQLLLNKFITDVEPEIAYFDEYGIASSAYPHYHSMKKISGAYKELKKLLPEDYDRIE
jgi:hypothetical protein